jgi:CubicO group peptidase (beta-lactamase class C family)
MLATGLIQYATKKTALEFAEQRLFKPMDFANYEWMHQDPAGVDNGGYGLRLRPVDMQKFGLLYLNRGVWRERRLISERWVETSFTPWNRTAWDLRRPDYGWFWWTIDGGAGWRALMANGWKGQRIAIFPEQKVVLTMTACIEDGSEHPVFEQLVAFVARAVHRNPAPENPQAQSRLSATLDEIRALPAPSCPGGGPRMIPSVAPKGKRVPFHS